VPSVDGGAGAADPAGADRRRLREALIWVPFSCALVPLALHWSGAGWQTALGAAALLTVLAALCLGALVVGGTGLRHVHDDEGPRASPH